MQVCRLSNSLVFSVNVHLMSGASHAVNRGSIPLGTTNYIKRVTMRIVALLVFSLMTGRPLWRCP